MQWSDVATMIVWGHLYNVYSIVSCPALSLFLSLPVCVHSTKRPAVVLFWFQFDLIALQQQTVLFFYSSFLF